MPARSPQVLLSGRIHVRHASVETAGQWTAFALYAAAFVVAVVPPLAAVAPAWLGELLLVPSVAWLFHCTRTLRETWTASEIHLLGDEVTVIRRGRLAIAFRLRSIRGWSTLPGGSTLVLELEGERTLTVAAASRDRVEHLLAALGVDAGRQRCRVTLLDGRDLADGIVAVLLGTAFGLLPPTTIPKAILFACGALVGLMSLTAFLVVPRVAVSVTVGLDGVEIQRGARRRFVSFDTSDDVRLTKDSIELTSAGVGTELLLRDKYMLEERLIALVERIRQALDARKAREGTHDRAQFLAREGRDVAAWRESMRGLARNGDGYRVATLSREEVAALLQDPSASVEHRLGAALALVDADEPDVAQKLRVAVDTCASPRMRVALEGITAATPDEMAIEEALAEEAAASPRRRQPS